MGADAKRDQPVLVARLGPLGERLGIAQVRQADRVGFGNLLGHEVADEHRLLAPLSLDALPRLDLGDVDFGRRLSEYVGRRAHLDDQRSERRDGADAGKADGRDVEEVAAADAPTFRVSGCGNLSRSCLGGHHIPLRRLFGCAWTALGRRRANW